MNKEIHAKNGNGKEKEEYQIRKEIIEKVAKEIVRN